MAVFRRDPGPSQRAEAQPVDRQRRRRPAGRTRTGPSGSPPPGARERCRRKRTSAGNPEMHSAQQTARIRRAGAVEPCGNIWQKPPDGERPAQPGNSLFTQRCFRGPWARRHADGRAAGGRGPGPQGRSSQLRRSAEEDRIGSSPCRRRFPRAAVGIAQVERPVLGQRRGCRRREAGGLGPVGEVDVLDPGIGHVEAELRQRVDLVVIAENMPSPVAARCRVVLHVADQPDVEGAARQVLLPGQSAGQFGVGPLPAGSPRGWPTARPSGRSSRARQAEARPRSV